MKLYTSLREVKRPDGKTCAALGMFDGLHVGHQAVIGAAVDLAGRENRASFVFTFSIHDDQHPAAKSVSGRLFTPELQAAWLERMGVDAMLRPPFEEFRSLSPRDFVEGLLRDTLNAGDVFCGENYHFGRDASGGIDELRRLCGGLGIGVHTVPLVELDGETVSSSRVRACVAQGDMPMAARLLGRFFAIDFQVVHGRRLGRTLDSPTINQPIPPWFAAPRFGVYASLTTVEGRRHVSVTNVGMKPTVGSDRLLSETYIQGFDGDLYGRRVLVELLEFIRPERRFASVAELREQIRRDSEAALLIGRRYPSD